MRSLVLGLLSIVLVIGFQIPAFAIPLPTADTSDLLSINIRCDTRVRYSFWSRAGTETYLVDAGENFCSDFISIVEGGEEISQETLDWWQATINFLRFTERIGALFYPVVFGLKFIHLIAHS